jgi:hypothetical protein
MQPRQRAFDHPPRAPETTPVVGATRCELGANATAVEGIAMELRIVGAVALDQSRLTHRSARTASHRRERVDQRQEFGDVVPIRRGQRRDERNPMRVGENMMF